MKTDDIVASAADAPALKHFWLKEDEQSIMDTATSTAAQYGWVGYFDVPTAWKTRTKAMVGTAVEAHNQLRIYNVAGACKFWTVAITPGAKRHEVKVHQLKAAVRLSPQQAMVMKLRHGGSDEAFLVADPTGESWGNLLIANAMKDQLYSYPFTRRRDWVTYAINDGGSFGPTLAQVGNYADWLEDNNTLKRAFVLDRDNWYESNDIVSPKPVPAFTGEAQLHPFTDNWKIPVKRKGHEWAVHFNNLVSTNNGMRAWMMRRFG